MCDCPPGRKTKITAVRSDFGFSAFSARNRINPGQLSDAMPLNPMRMKLRREVSGPAQRTRGEVGNSELMASATYGCCATVCSAKEREVAVAAASASRTSFELVKLVRRV